MLVVVVVVVEHKVVVGLGRSSYSDVGTLVVVVGLEGREVLGVLLDLEVLPYLEDRVLLEVLVVLLVLAHLDLLVVPSFLGVLVVLALVVEEVEVVGMVVGVVVVEVDNMVVVHME